jgi:proteasome accessory factor B
VDVAKVVIRPEDRLFHLTLALMATSVGLTKEHILSTVRGYREDTEAGVAKATIERRFERDKDLLRELGIPLQAVIPPDEDGNNKATVYRIPKVDYDPPAGFELSAQDIRLLNVAAAVWKEGSLSSEARVTHTKLAASGIGVDEPLIGFLPMLTARDPALDVLRRAISEGRQVRFDYVTPGDTESKTRTVSPLAVVLHENRWHLLSVEEPGGAEKTFLLRRIVSAIETRDEQSRGASEGQVERMSAELSRIYRDTTAVIRPRAGSAAEVVFGHREGTEREGDALVVHFTDLGAFAHELLEYAHDITVVEPAELREQMANLLNQVVTHHG